MAPLNLADALVIKRENLFLIAPRDGELPAQPHPLGLWYRDTRFLSTHRLLLNGDRPVLLEGSDLRGTSAVHVLTDPARSLSLRLERSLDEEPGLLVERIVLSRPSADAALAVDLALDADFAPMLEVRGLVERPEPRVVEAVLDGRTMRWAVHGRDGVARSTVVELSETPAQAADGNLRFGVAGAEWRLELKVAIHEGAERSRPARPQPPEPAGVGSNDERFGRILARSVQDLELLRSELDGQSYFAAGIPWFATLFGRDSLITAMQTIPLLPGVSEETLRLLAGRQGRELDDEREEEPGKILHELRVGEPAALGETPFARYYGSADATLLWLCLLADHADWSGSLELFRELRGQVNAALDWIDTHGDLDGDGLVEYRRRSPHGLRNQGWKDSPAGVPDAGGRPLEPPVALVEVQGYAVRALREAARLFELDGDAARASELRERSARTEAALERFWVEEAGGYAIGLDGDKRPGSPLTSNQGHLLWAGALPAARAAAVRDRLMEEPMFSGWGVRTLAEGHPGFDPAGYHIGSVWPHDNAIIASGLRRYGFDRDFLRILEAMLEAGSRFPGHTMPELFGGHARTPGGSPVPYPVACRPQAWAAGSIPHLIAGALGLRPEGLAGRLRIVRPLLPGGIDWLEVEGLRVAGASVGLRFQRSASGVELADARVDGPLDVVVE